MYERIKTNIIPRIINSSKERQYPSIKTTNSKEVIRKLPTMLIVIFFIMLKTVSNQNS